MKIPPASVLVVLALASCGSDPVPVGPGATGGLCALDPKGTFVLHLHNASGVPVLWNDGCGTGMPFDLETPGGTVSAGSGRIGDCGASCDEYYAGPVYCLNMCEARGGTGTAAGATTNLMWDRRVYGTHTVDAACSSQADGRECAWGQAVAPNPAQKGTLRLCEKYLTYTCERTRDVPFTIDTTKDEATIEIPPR